MSIKLPRPSVLVTPLTTPRTLPLRALTWSTVALRSSTPRLLPPTLMVPKLADVVADEWARVSAALATADRLTPLSWISGASVRVPSRSSSRPLAGGFRPLRAVVRGPDPLVTVDVRLLTLQAEGRPPMPLTGRFRGARSPPRMPPVPSRESRPARPVRLPTALVRPEQSVTPARLVSEVTRPVAGDSTPGMAPPVRAPRPGG